MFYPESWALVHYLHTVPDNIEKMGEYLRLLGQGTNTVDAFVEAYGMSTTQLNRYVKSYVRNGEFQYLGIKIDTLADDFQASSRQVSREEISLVLGKAALRGRELKQAQRWFDIAATESSTSAQAQAGIGDVYKFNKRYDEAEPYFSRAVELDPQNVPILIDMGQYWLSKGGIEKDKETKAQHLETARRYFGKAWKLDERAPEIYAMYGRSFLMQRDYEKSLDSLSAANRLLPSYIGVRLDLALAHLGTGNLEEAYRHAQAVKVWSHEKSGSRKKAEKLLKRIELAVEAAAETDSPAE